MQYRRHIIVLTTTIAVVVALTLLTWRLAGPESVSISILGATLVSRLIDDRLSGRRLAWGRAVAQGALGGAAARVMLLVLPGD